MKRPIPVLVMAVLIGLALPAGLEGPAFGQEYGSPDRPEPPAGQSLLVSLQALFDNLFDCGFGFGLGEGGLAFSPSGDHLLTAGLTPPAVAQSTQTRLRCCGTGIPASPRPRRIGLGDCRSPISPFPSVQAADLPSDSAPRRCRPIPPRTHTSTGWRSTFRTGAARRTPLRERASRRT